MTSPSDTSLAERLGAWSQNSPDPDFFRGDTLDAVLNDCGSARDRIEALEAERDDNRVKAAEIFRDAVVRACDERMDEYKHEARAQKARAEAIEAELAEARLGWNNCSELLSAAVGDYNTAEARVRELEAGLPIVAYMKPDGEVLVPDGSPLKELLAGLRPVPAPLGGAPLLPLRALLSNSSGDRE